MVIYKERGRRGDGWKKDGKIVEEGNLRWRGDPTRVLSLVGSFSRSLGKELSSRMFATRGAVVRFTTVRGTFAMRLLSAA